MREALFIKKNVEKWNRYQNEPASDPDETADRFINLMDDVSYAKTFYPRSKVTRWLNGLAASTYQDVYQNKKEKYSRLVDFWKYDLPYLFKKHHSVLLFTFLAFSLFVIIGVLASRNDPDFIRSILGDRYVDETEENIAKGDPFGIYKDQNPFNMFIYIAFNNIRVAFITFAGGLPVGIFTMKVLWDNGLMLGSFQNMFFQHGLGFESILVIWIHGTIEMSSVIIAGTSGFIVAKGILFPGTFSRLESFKRGFKDAAKLLLSLIPFFIIASFLENYITQLMSQTYTRSQSGMPVWVSLLILASSLFLITWYFVIWPLKLHRKGYFKKRQGITAILEQQNA